LLGIKRNRSVVMPPPPTLPPQMALF